MAAFITFLTANAGVILGFTLALLSFLTAVLNKNEKAVGIIAVIRGIVERLSLLQPKNSEGTVKLPGTKSGPKAVMEAKYPPLSVQERERAERLAAERKETKGDPVVAYSRRVRKP